MIDISNHGGQFGGGKYRKGSNIETNNIAPVLIKRKDSPNLMTYDTPFYQDCFGKVYTYQKGQTTNYIKRWNVNDGSNIPEWQVVAGFIEDPTSITVNPFTGDTYFSSRYAPYVVKKVTDNGVMSTLISDTGTQWTKMWFINDSIYSFDYPINSPYLPHLKKYDLYGSQLNYIQLPNRISKLSLWGPNQFVFGHDNVLYAYSSKDFSLIKTKSVSPFSIEEVIPMGEFVYTIDNSSSPKLLRKYDNGFNLIDTLQLDSKLVSYTEFLTIFDNWLILKSGKEVAAYDGNLNLGSITTLEGGSVAWDGVAGKDFMKIKIGISTNYYKLAYKIIN